MYIIERMFLMTFFNSLIHDYIFLLIKELDLNTNNNKEFFSKLFLDSYGIFLDEIDRLRIVRQIVIKYHDNHLQYSLTKKTMEVTHNDPLLVEMANSLTSKDKLMSTSDLIKYHLLVEINRSEANKTKIPDFIRNMILVHLVSSFESFLRRNLYIFHFYQPNSLITNDRDKNLTYEQILSCKSYEKIINKIIQKELDSLFRGGIDDIIKYLKTRLNLDLEIVQSSDYSLDYEEFRERFYRRNIISHNEGIINEEYASKTKRKINIGKLIGIDDLYVTKSIQLFLDYTSFLEKFFERKM